MITLREFWDKSVTGWTDDIYDIWKATIELTLTAHKAHFLVGEGERRYPEAEILSAHREWEALMIEAGE